MRGDVVNVVYSAQKNKAGFAAWFPGCWFVLWFVSSVSLLTKYFGLVLSAWICGAVLIIAIAATRALQQRGGTLQFRCPAIVIAGLWLVAVAAFEILNPLSHMHLFGAGSDRDSALANAVSALLRGKYPYYARSDHGNTIFVLPGSLLLAAPFKLAGSLSLQSFAWLALFGALARPLFFSSASTTVLFLAMFFFAPIACLQDFVTGGDYTINCLYVAMAIACVLRAYEEDHRPWTRFAAAAFLGIVLCTRPTFAVALPLVAAFVAQHRGPRDAAVCCGTGIALAVAMTLPFYLYDPASFTPAQIGGKLFALPAVLLPAISVPTLGLAVASSGFFVTLRRTDVYGLTALALTPLFLPQVGLAAINGRIVEAQGESVYLVAITIFGGIWLLCRWERKRSSTDINYGQASIPLNGEVIAQLL